MIAALYYAKGENMPVCQDDCALEVVEHQRKSTVLMVVCDGIGGLEQGEYASRFVVSHIREWFYDIYLKHYKCLWTGKQYREMTHSCSKMLYGCHTKLNQYGLSNHCNLGTTMTMLIVQNSRYYLFHVGDSRAYKIGRKCKCITKDDVYKQNILTKCIGSFPWNGLMIDKGYIRKKQGLLVCSDGIYKAFTEDELRNMFHGMHHTTEKQLKKRLTKLAETARLRGIKDDQSGIVYLGGGRYEA